MGKFRWWPGVPCAVAVVFCVLWWRQGDRVRELERRISGSPTTIPAHGTTVDLGEQGEWTVRFPVAMATEDGVEDGARVRAEPPLRLLSHWVSDRVLRVQPLGPVGKGAVWHLTLDEKVRSADGRRIPSNVELIAEGPRPRCLGAQWDRPDDPLGPVVSLRFDAPIFPDSLREGVQVLAENLPVPWTLEPTAKASPVARLRLPPRPGSDTVNYVVRVGALVTGADGPLPLGQESEHRLVLDRTLRWESLDAAQDGLVLRFDRPVLLPDASTFQIEPAVPHQVFVEGANLRIQGEFPHGTPIVVVLEEGFLGAHGSRLPQRVRRSVLRPDLPAQMALMDGGSILSALARPELLVLTTNLEGFEVAIRPVYANNLVPVAHERQEWGLPDTACGPWRKLTVPQTAVRNAVQEQVVNLSDLLPTTRGIHELRLTDVRGAARPVRRLLQVTDLGLTVRATERDVTVRVSSLATARPVLGAQVEVVSPTNQVLVTGSTDARGVVVLPCEKIQEDATPFLVRARTEADFAYVDLTHHRVELTNPAFAGRPPDRNLSAWMDGDRGVARPGETMRVLAMVRDGAGAGPSGEVLTARWRDGARRVIQEERVTVPQTGLLGLSIPVPEDAATGSWTVSLDHGDETIGRASQRVEAYVPDRIEAEVEWTTALVLGTEGTLRVVARFLDGTPAAGVPCRVTVRFDHGRLQVAGSPGFVWDAPTTAPPPGDQPPVRLTLDEHGVGVLRVPMPGSSGGSQTLSASVIAEVLDDGRPVFARSTAPVLRADVHVGLRPEGPTACSVAVTDGKLQPVKSAPDESPIQVLFEQRWWESEWERRPNGSYHFVTRRRSRVLEERAVAWAGDPVEVTFSGSAPSEGWLVARATVAGAFTEVLLGSETPRPDRLRVSAPADPVVAGRPFVVQVVVPVPGELLLTLEGDRTWSATTASLGAGTHSLEVTCPPEVMAANLHVVGTLRAPLVQAGGPKWLVGGDRVVIDRSARRSVVTVEAPGSVRPDSVISAEIHAPGCRSAYATLVDVGVLNLTGHGPPDPHGWFNAARRLMTQGADGGPEVMTRVRFDPGAVVGGDGGDGLGPRLRSGIAPNIQSLALWQPISLDEGGHGRVEFPLPDYEGRVRLAVVASGDHVWGSHHQDITVRAPLGVRLSTPRVLAPGDEPVVTVAVWNGTGAAREVVIRGDAEGLLSGQPLQGTARLEDGESRTWSWPVAALEGHGTGVLRVTAQNENGSEVRTRSASLAIRPPLAWVADRRGFVLDGDDASVVVDGAWEGDVELRVRVDGGLDAQLLPALLELIRYPHGCLEQTTSRCRALLAGSRLWSSFHPDGDTMVSGDPDLLLRQGIRRILAMQGPRGGVGWWSATGDEFPFGTVYAADLLLDAKTHGHEVPPPELARLLDRVEHWVRRSDDVSLRAYGASVLARGGRVAGPWIETLATGDLPDDARHHLVRALVGLGDLTGASALLAPKNRGAPLSNGVLSSPLRSAALEFLARLEVDPADPQLPVLKARLSEALREPRRLTTQELAHGFDALAAGLARQPDDQPRLQEVVVTIGQHTQALRPGEEGRFTVRPGDWVSCAGRGGKGFGLWEWRGFRRPSGDPSEPALVQRRLLDRETGEPATSLRRGGLYDIELVLTTTKEWENVLLTELLPAGLEAVRSDFEGARWSPREGDQRRTAARMEVQDDRVLLFFPEVLRPGDRVVVPVRGVTPGEFSGGATLLEALYDLSLRSEVGWPRMRVLP